jgi:hypothetical protein
MKLGSIKNLWHCLMARLTLYRKMNRIFTDGADVLSIAVGTAAMTVKIKKHFSRYYRIHL